VGLRPDTEHYGDRDQAIDFAGFNQYVHSDFYHHDVEFEYIYQTCPEGSWKFDIFSSDSDVDELAESFRDTRVGFVKRDCSSNPVPYENVIKTRDDVRQYRDRFLSVWPSDSSRAKYRYSFISLPHLLREAGGIDGALGYTVPDVDGSGKYNDVICLANESITETFDSYTNELKMWTATHEFGHAVGLGLVHYCDYPEMHDDPLCVMSNMAVTLGHPALPFWACGSDSLGNFEGEYHFCNLCIARMNDIDFLLPDYWYLARTSPNGTRIEHRREQ
jgi:hypothetical protein